MKTNFVSPDAATGTTTAFNETAYAVLTEVFNKLTERYLNNRPPKS